MFLLVHTHPSDGKGGTKRRTSDEELTAVDSQQAQVSKKPRLGGTSSRDVSPPKKMMSPSTGGGVVNKQAEQMMRVSVDKGRGILGKLVKKSQPFDKLA